ncbi:MAG: hypothetical protein HKN58_09905 [Xanthomonadales bacterium]|nr:hypothetical protein [Xanthomonadales bacterium]
MKAISPFLIGAAMALLSAPVHAVTIYLTETDADGTVYKVDTDTATFQTFDVSPQERPGAIAVLGNRIVMSNYDDNDTWAYDLNFNPTGESWSGSGTWDQALDGTTDGVSNYASVWSDTGVVRFDLNFQNGELLFDPGFEVIGITYDSATNTLWLVNDQNHNIHNYTLGGVEVDFFDTGLNGRECCLAYDPETDTLWLSENGGTSFYQFDKDGNLLDTVTLSGFSPDNTWGAEIGSDAAPVTPVPVNSRWAVLALAVLLLGWGAISLSRRSRVAG